MEFYDRIINLKYFDYFDDIFSQRELEIMNLYMSSDENYKKLQEILENSKVSFATGNIFDLKTGDLKENDFDIMLLSNVMQCLVMSDNKLIEEQVYEVYLKLSKYLNKNGIIQLYYLYGSIYPKAFSKIANYFLDDKLLLEKINWQNSKDSVILVKKMI